jgi:Plasmid pRiA4b ORF-3-like protein
VEVYVFDAKLEQWGPYVREPVGRKLALPADRTLADLHLLIQEAFEWDDDHLYSFWLDGTFWGDDETEYTFPFELDERGGRSAEVGMDTLGLERGRKIAYIFDFGDEWRVSLKLREIRDGGETGILERKGEPPPQYPDLDDEEDDAP